MMWYQGLDHAPTLIRRLHSIWQHQLQNDPALTATFLAGADVDDLIQSQGIDPTGLTMQVRANLVRVHLLTEKGGVWLDATLLPSRPLSVWLTPELRCSGFFAFRNPARDRMLSNWFLFADCGNYAITRWRDIYFDYFRSPRKLNKHAPWHIHAAQGLRAFVNPASFGRPRIAQSSPYYPYRVQHYLFAYLHDSDPTFAQVWKNTPFQDGSAAGLLKKSIAQSEKPVSEADILAILQNAPVHKLNWRKSDQFDGVLDMIERQTVKD